MFIILWHNLAIGAIWFNWFYLWANHLMRTLCTIASFRTVVCIYWSQWSAAFFRNFFPSHTLVWCNAFSLIIFCAKFLTSLTEVVWLDYWRSYWLLWFAFLTFHYTFTQTFPYFYRCASCNCCCLCTCCSRNAPFSTEPFTFQTSGDLFWPLRYCYCSTGFYSCKRPASSLLHCTERLCGILFAFFL